MKLERKSYPAGTWCSIFSKKGTTITPIDKIRENGFELTKRRSKRYPAKTITDAD